jgi:hypothetical protein
VVAVPRLFARERRALIVGNDLFGDLTLTPALSVSETCADGAVPLSGTLKPDLVFVDARATDDVPKLVAAIRDVSRDSSVIVVGEPHAEDELSRAIAAGATGFIGSRDPMLPLLGTLIGATPPLGACA